MTKNITIMTEEISCVSVEITEDYATSFLHIFNNVREDEDLYKVENDYGNTVYVYCSNDVVDALKSYLSQFGDIKDVTKYLMVSPISVFTYSDEFYGVIMNPAEY